MSRKTRRRRVAARESGYLADRHRQPFRMGRMRRDMSPRRARTAKAAQSKRFFDVLFGLRRTPSPADPGSPVRTGGEG